jgi:hypothetical protein
MYLSKWWSKKKASCVNKKDLLPGGCMMTNQHAVWGCEQARCIRVTGTPPNLQHVDAFSCFIGNKLSSLKLVKSSWKLRIPIKALALNSDQTTCTHCKHSKDHEFIQHLLNKKSWKAKSRPSRFWQISSWNVVLTPSINIPTTESNSPL